MTKKVHDSDEDVLKEAANMKSVQGGVSAETARRLKYISLITLTGQNAILGLSMRYSRTRDGDLFYEATAVLMAEVVRNLHNQVWQSLKLSLLGQVLHLLVSCVQGFRLRF